MLCSPAQPLREALAAVCSWFLLQGPRPHFIHLKISNKELQAHSSEEGIGVKKAFLGFLKQPQKWPWNVEQPLGPMSWAPSRARTDVGLL